jgi:potassium-dependent mechanosensitive channel
MASTRKCRGSLAHAALIALLLLSATTFGATPGALSPAQQPAQQPAQRAIEPIGIGDILERADADERFIQEIIAQARKPDPAAKLLPSLETLARDLRNLSEMSDRDALESLPAIGLQILQRYWSFYNDRLAVWRDELRRVTTRYSDAAAELGKQKAAWEATRTSAAASGLPAALSDRVNAILAEIALAEQALSGSLDSRLKLASRANSVQETVDAGTTAVRAASDIFDRRLLTIDAPPLLKAWSDGTPPNQALSLLTRGWTIENEFLTEYYAAYGGKQLALGIAALGMLALLLWGSRRGRKLVANDPDLQSSAEVLLRPISSWLVLVVLGVLYFDADAPMIVLESALFLALIPVLRLLPRREYAVLGPWPYIVTALYLLFQLGFLLVGVPLVERLHLLMIGVLTLAAILWLLIRPLDHEAMVHSTALRMVGGLLAAAVLVGVVANVIGNVSLSEALTGGVVSVCYAALALYVARAVLNAILKLGLALPAVSGLSIATQHKESLLRGLSRLLNIAALAMWLVVALKSFRVYRPVEQWVSGALKQSLELGQISITLGDALLFLASVWVSFWLAKLIRIVLREEVLLNRELPHGVANSISTLTYYAVLTIGLIVALAATGFQLSQVTIVVGALSVGIGFGLQNIVNNFVSGLILMFERPIQPGDVVDVAGTSGTVREIGMRATRLKTFEGADVVVPNGALLSDKLINWTLSDTSRRLDVNVGVAYGSDLKRVLDILMDAAKATPGVAASPEPEVVFSIGPSSLEFGIRAWTDDFNNWGAIRSNMTVRVYDALMGAGIEVPFPQQDLHLRSISPEVRADLAAVGARRGG